MAKTKKKKNGGKRKKAPEAPKSAVETGKGNPGPFVLGGVGASLAGQIGGESVGPTKKGSKPSVQCHLKNGEGEQWVDVYLEALRAKKSASALMDDAFAELAPELEEARKSISRRTGEFQTSIDVNGRLTFVQQHKYHEIAPSRAEALVGIFGSGDFSKYFKAVTDIKLNMDQLEQNSELAEAIIEAIKEACEEHDASLADVLKTKVVLKPTEELSRARVMDADVGRKFEEARDAGLVSPAKATLKEK